MAPSSTLTRSTFLALCTLLLFPSNPVKASCFHPNGTQTADVYRLPCSSDLSNPLSSICCAIGRPNPAGGLASAGTTSDSCLPNGVCMNQKKASVYDANPHTEYFREECTNQDWKSGKCPTFCLSNVSTFPVHRYRCLTATSTFRGQRCVFNNLLTYIRPLETAEIRV
jgi:hypothetical protein